MNIQKIFDEMNCIEGLRVDTVLFEAHYPILFTCTAMNDVYLAICCKVTSQEIIWILSKTEYATIVDMLQNQMTIRDAFLAESKDKYILKYRGPNKSYLCDVVSNKDIDETLLPTFGEYIEAEDNEFDDEINEFKKRMTTYCTFVHIRKELKTIILNKSIIITNKEDCIEEQKFNKKDYNTYQQIPIQIKKHIN